MNIAKSLLAAVGMNVAVGDYRKGVGGQDWDMRSGGPQSLPARRYDQSDVGCRRASRRARALLRGKFVRCA